MKTQPTPHGSKPSQPYRKRPIPRLWLGTILLALLGTGGCIDYTVETTLRPDGSGTREIRMEVRDAEDNLEVGLSRREFQEIMSVTSEAGWSHEAHVESGDTTHVFLRENRVPALNDWSRLGGDIRIQGVPPARASSSLGYLSLGDVEFRNQILVSTRRESDGSAAFSYVETFQWENGVEAILEVMLAQMEESLTANYPDLSDRGRGEILGTARARLWEAVEDGAFEDDDAWDELWARAIRRTAQQGTQVVQQRYPSETEDALRENIDLFHGELEEELDSAFLRTLPGLYLALNSEITFSLTMPGVVTSTNAHEQEGNVLRWEISPGDALSAPLVLTADSEIRGSLEVPGPAGHR